MIRQAVVLALAAAVAASGVARSGPRPQGAPPALEGVPRYSHVFVILEENKDYEQILDPAAAPNIAGLAAQYGNAARFYAEVHPSEANYVALLGGDTFGIHDDDAFYCKPGSEDRFCPGAKAAGYVDHTVRAPHLGDQLTRAGRTWKGYYEDLPAPGSDAVYTGDPVGLYASKHSGFMNFADVQADPHRAERIVGFDQLQKDLASGVLPDFALIVPNQCNEMHGLHDVAHLPPDCDQANKAALIRRGDAEVGRLVKAIQATAAWNGPGNVAIVITFDEGSGPKAREGCCGITPGAASNYGGGHIPTVVVTNHGPRGLSDRTPYSHYSMLRTLEDAFGISEHLGHAAETRHGVLPMAKLFAVTGAR